MGDLFGQRGVTAEEFNQCAARPANAGPGIASAITGFQSDSGGVERIRIDTAETKNNEQNNIQTHIDFKNNRIESHDTGIGPNGLRAQASAIRQAMACMKR